MTTLNRIVRGLVCLVLLLAFSGCNGGETEPADVQEAAPAPPATQPAEGAGAQANPAPSEVPATLAAMASQDPSARVADPPEPQLQQLSSKTDRVRRDTPPAKLGASTVVLEPSVLDLGVVPTNENPTGAVRLINTGDETVTIRDCKSNCGCTTTNCPKGHELKPGESTEVDVRVTAGSRGRRISKTVTFIVDGQPQLKLPVRVEVVSYVAIEPETIDPEKMPDGRVVLRSTDDEPFRVISMTPPIISDFDAEPRVEHELFLSWETWRQLGQGRKLAFRVDHPKATSVQAYVRSTSARRRSETASKSLDRDPALQGIVDAPLDSPVADAKVAVAIKYGDVAAIEVALKEVTDTAARNAMLGLAARYGRVEVFQTLFEAGADVNAVDRRGQTPLMSAVQSRKTEAIRTLLAKGAKVDARDQVIGGTALTRAAGPFGDASGVQALLEAGADVNVVDKNGMTPLIWAARFGDAKRVAALIKAGAEVNVRDNRGLSPLDYAVRRRPTW
ncbi:MAG: ankyrin repeat domain-containing protein [Planctomycetota bacterium]